MGDPKRKRRTRERWDLEGNTIQSSAAGHVPRAGFWRTSASTILYYRHALLLFAHPVETQVSFVMTDNGDT